jgi:hypothetical protein
VKYCLTVIFRVTVTLNRPPSAKPRSPGVSGFDLPGSGSGPGGVSNQILSARLDCLPSSAWLATFAVLAERFKQDTGVDDVRVVGTSLNITGSREQLRALPNAVRLLVETVGNQVVRNRVNARPPVASPAGGLVSEWVDEQLRRMVPAVPEILHWLHRHSDMRFTAIARVTDVSWTTLAFYDTSNFGMTPYRQLVLEDTICSEIRQHRQSVAFGNASTDPIYKRHHVPGLYGFESYISIPILTPQGGFFGTLCALDSLPKTLTEELIREVEVKAQWIGGQLAHWPPAAEA